MNGYWLIVISIDNILHIFTMQNVHSSLLTIDFDFFATEVHNFFTTSSIKFYHDIIRASFQYDALEYVICGAYLSVQD